MNSAFHTPVLLLIFNRLETTQQVFEILQTVQPTRLYIAGDGARPEKEGEKEKCHQVRDWVLNAIDWPCEIKTNFQDANLGCGKHVSQAITWFFEHVDEGIILEDDCVPHPDFFSYCSTLLETHRENQSVFTIGGNNFQEKEIGNGSYYFSTYGHIWGWATWKRAWSLYKYDLNDFSSTVMKKQMRYYFRNLQAFDYWWRIFDLMRTQPVDTWDYQWSFCQWYHGGLSIMPKANLVSNIGYGEEATHTKNFVEGILLRPVQSLSKIQHPASTMIQRKADLHSFYTNFEKKKPNYLLIKVKEKLSFEIKKRIFRSSN